MNRTSFYPACVSQLGLPPRNLRSFRSHDDDDEGVWPSRKLSIFPLPSVDDGLPAGVRPSSSGVRVFVFGIKDGFPPLQSFWFFPPSWSFRRSSSFPPRGLSTSIRMGTPPAYTFPSFLSRRTLPRFPARRVGVKTWVDGESGKTTTPRRVLDGGRPNNTIPPSYLSSFLRFLRVV